MRKLIAFLAAGAGILLASCSEQNLIQGENIPLQSSLKLRAWMPEINGLEYLWEYDDKVVLSVNGGASVAQAVYPYSDYKTASLGSAFKNIKKDDVLTVIYPKSAVVDMSARQLTLPSVQDLSSDSPCRNAVLMSTKELVTNPDSMDIKLTPLTSFLELEIEGIPASERVSSIKISSDEPISGSAVLDESMSHIVPSSDASKSVVGSVKDQESKFIFSSFALSKDAINSLKSEVNTASGDTYTGVVTSSKESVAAGEYAVLRSVVDLKPKPSPKADLLDVMFNQDGTAVDTSAGKSVARIYSNLMASYKPDEIDMVAARFNHDFNEQPVVNGPTLQSSGTYGYYRYDYSGDVAFQTAYSKAHSISCLFSVDYVPTRDVVIAGSFNDGGSAIMIHDGHICSAENAPDLVICDSGIEPVPGRYYHVVSTYSANSGKMILYVDAEIKASAAALEYKESSIKAFTIGAAPKDGIEGMNGMRGAVANVKIMSSAMSLSEVKGLYGDLVPKTQEVTDFFTVADLRILQAQVVMSGDSYIVAGKGLLDGDKISFESVSDNSTFESSGYTFKDGTYQVINAVIPDGMSDGFYRVVLRRGSRKLPLGTVQFVFNLNLYDRTKITAISQNSYASTGEKIEKSIDGNLNTGWQANWGTYSASNITHKPHDGMFYELVYKIEKQNLAAIVICENDSPYGRADLKELEILVSSDGVIWNRVFKGVKYHGVHLYGKNADINTAFVLDAPVEAEYIKLAMDDSWRYTVGGMCCNNVRELNIYTK